MRETQTGNRPGDRTAHQGACEHKADPLDGRAAAPVLQEIARQTPDIEWEQKEEYHPLGLRGAVLIRGRIKNGSPVFVTFTELGNDLWFDTDSVCSRFAPETLGALNGMNTLSASVKDGTPLLEYIRKQQLKHQQP